MPSSPSGSSPSSRHPPWGAFQSKRPAAPDSRTPAGSRPEPGHRNGGTHKSSLTERGRTRNKENTLKCTTFDSTVNIFILTVAETREYPPQPQTSVTCYFQWWCCKSFWKHTVDLQWKSKSHTSTQQNTQTHKSIARVPGGKKYAFFWF